MADSSISFYPAYSLCSSVHSEELAKLHLHRSYLAPVIIVSKPSQLPAEFLKPSPLRKLVIGFDNEGVRLSRHGALCVMQLAFNHSIYLVDAIEGGEVLIKACKAGLESEHVTKVIHDCKGDGEALFFQFGIKLNNVVDTQIAYSLLEEQEGRKTAEHVSFVELLANARYCGAPYPEKEEVRQMLKSNPQFWRHRPITQFMASTAAYDVRFLIHIYHRVMAGLSQRSLWYLAVRSALYCRCYCGGGDDDDEWPSLPPAPEVLRDDDGMGPEVEGVWVMDVPEGTTKLVIGKAGKTIRRIRENNDAEIHVGGPPDKVFIIGTEDDAIQTQLFVRGEFTQSSNLGPPLLTKLF